MAGGWQLGEWRRGSARCRWGCGCGRVGGPRSRDRPGPVRERSWARRHWRSHAGYDKQRTTLGRGGLSGSGSGAGSGTGAGAGSGSWSWRDGSRPRRWRIQGRRRQRRRLTLGHRQASAEEQSRQSASQDAPGHRHPRVPDHPPRQQTLTQLDSSARRSSFAAFFSCR